MALIYFMDISKVSKEMIHTNWKYLDNNRKNKILSLNNEDEIKRSFGTGLLISWLLYKNNIPINNLKFTSDNKPYINNWFHISISHNGKYTCIALSNTPIGVDIQENIGYLKHIEEHYFSNEDKQIINSNIHKFYELWCQKESYIKLFGFKDLKLIPHHIDYYYYHNFYVDSYFGCLLTEDKDFLLENINLSKIIKDLESGRSECDGKNNY